MSGCPTPDKHAYENPYTARKGLSRALRKGAHGGRLPRRFYRCPCGKYHLTHKPRRGAL